MKKIIFILLILNQAQAEIRGTVFEKGRQIKLPDINIYVPAENITVTSDKDGNFILHTQQPTAEVKINSSEFLPFTTTVNNGQNLTIYLQRKVRNQGLSLMVEDTNYKKDQAKKTLSRKQIFEMPGAQGDAVKALQNMPGVNRGQGFSSQVIIQGSAPKDTTYDFEGHEIPIAFHFGGLSSVIMPEAVEKVDYYSAGYQAERSRALGGIISLATRYPEVDERSSKGLFYLDTLSAGGLFESKINDKSSFLISGRYSYIGIFLNAATRDSDDFDLTVAPEFYDITGVYRYQLGENENFKISLINSKDRLAFLRSEPVRDDPELRGNFSQMTTFFRVVPSWEKQIDTENNFKLSLGYGRDHINFDFGSNYFDIKTKNFSTRGSWEHRFNSDLNINLGWDNVYSDAEAKVLLPLSSSSGGVSNPISSGETRDADIHVEYNSLGLFTQAEYQMTSALKVVPGVRADIFSIPKESHILPRLAAQYKHDDSLLLKLGSGQYVQAPEPQETSKDFGNPDLTSPKATHATFGFDKQFEGGHFFSMNGFYKKLTDLVIASSKKKIKDGVEVFELYSNDGEGQVLGLENQWKYQKGDWQWIVAYTWSKSTRKNPIQGEYNFEYDQTHNLNVISMYQFTETWKFSGRYRYVTGNPYTPVIGSIYDADNETYFPVRGPIYSERNKPFQQLDIRIDKKVISDKSIWTFYLDIQNILNIKNPEGLQYSYDYSVKQEITGLPILPALGIRGEF